MNTAEARTREALHDVVDRIEVSGQDVARMEHELARRSGTVTGPVGVVAGRSRRRLLVAVAAVVLLAVGVAGLSSRDADPTQPAGAPAQPAGAPAQVGPLVPPELVGTWRNVPDSLWVWEFSADGHLGAVESASSYLAGGTRANTVTRRVDDVYTTVDPDGCITEMRISPTSPEAVAVTMLSGTCEVEEGLELQLERVAPGPAGARAQLPHRSPGTPFARRNIGFLDGTWLHVESGTVLAVGSPAVGDAHTYVMDDDGDGATRPDQRGLVTLAQDGAVQARPFASDTVGCSPNFASIVTDGARMTTTSAAGGCFPVGSSQTWVGLN